MSFKASSEKIAQFLNNQMMPITMEIIEMSEAIDSYINEQQEIPQEAIEQFIANIMRAESGTKFTMTSYKQMIEDLTKITSPEEAHEEEEQKEEDEATMIRELASHTADVIKALTTRGIDEDIIGMLTEYDEALLSLIS